MTRACRVHCWILEGLGCSYTDPCAREKSDYLAKLVGSWGQLIFPLATTLTAQGLGTQLDQVRGMSPWDFWKEDGLISRWLLKGEFRTALGSIVLIPAWKWDWLACFHCLKYGWCCAVTASLISIFRSAIFIQLLDFGSEPQYLPNITYDSLIFFNGPWLRTSMHKKQNSDCPTSLDQHLLDTCCMPSPAWPDSTLCTGATSPPPLCLSIQSTAKKPSGSVCLCSREHYGLEKWSVEGMMTEGIRPMFVFGGGMIIVGRGDHSGVLGYGRSRVHCEQTFHVALWDCFPGCVWVIGQRDPRQD